MSFSAAILKDMLGSAVKNNASDVHIREGEKPCFRIHGQMTPLKSKEFSREDMFALVNILLASKSLTLTQEDLRKDWDGSYEIEGLCRVRFNIFSFQGRLATVMRLIKMKVPSIEDLTLPLALKKIAMRPRGMILVTGPTGMGKSTTMAAMLSHINQNRRAHIITLEDPIEYLHSNHLCRLTQREVGVDIPDFVTGLRSALRQDPDVITIGEMRDTETISIAMKAAETGHLVFSTLHTTDVLATIGRIIGMFPAEEQDNIRKRLADSLLATVGQRLVKTTDGRQVAVLEIMVMNPGIRDCILGKEELGNIYTHIQEGQTTKGSQTFDQHLRELLKAGVIDEDTAAEAASASDFLKKLEFH